MANQKPTGQASRSRQSQGGKSGAQAAKPIQSRSASSKQAASTRQPAGTRQPANGKQPAAAQAKQPAKPRTGSGTAATEVAAVEQPKGFVGLLKSMSWVQITALVLSVLGMLDAIYLTIQDLNPSGIPTGCNSSGTVDCAAVLSSPESKLFGVIPVAVLGLAFFVGMLVLNSPWAWRADRRPILLPWAQVRRIRMTAVGIGMLFVLYLVYVEIIELGHICLYCTGVHIITFLLFSLLVFHTTFNAEPADLS
jgi:uncharacterized membrane protein